MTGEGVDDSHGWWLRLGGPNAISVIAWLFTLVGGTVAAFSWIPGGPNFRPLQWIGLSIVAQLILGGILFVAWLTYLSPQPRPSRPMAFIVTLLVAGFIRGAFLSLAGEEFDLVEHGYALQRATGAALAFTVWYAVATLIVDGWRRHRAVVARLRAEMTREQELAERSNTLLSNFRSTVVAQTQRALREGLQSASASSGEPAVASASLRRTVDDLIRPLSHELEKRATEDAELLATAESPPEVPHVPFRSYVAGIFTARPFAPLVTAAIIIATPLVVSMHVLGPLLGAVSVFMSAAVVGLSLWALRTPIMDAIPRWSVLLSATVVIATWVGVTLVVGLLLATLVNLSGRHIDTWLASAGVSTTGSSVLVLVAMALTTMIAAAVEGSVEHQLRTAREQLREAVLSVEWASARLRQRAWTEQRNFGRLLHGTVQATMVAAALKVREQSPEEAAVTISGLTTRLQYALGAGFETPWQGEITNLSDVWDGAIDLTVNVTPSAARALDEDSLAAHCLFQVLSESVTNAVRHGDANSVRVTVEVEPGYLLLTVRDDGTPKPTMGRGGTGSKIYEANCSDWQLTFDSTTTLRARIAWRSTETAHGIGGSR